MGGGVGNDDLHNTHNHDVLGGNRCVIKTNCGGAIPWVKGGEDRAAIHANRKGVNYRGNSKPMLKPTKTRKDMARQKPVSPPFLKKNPTTSSSLTTNGLQVPE